jgi:hypothetical protein
VTNSLNRTLQLIIVIIDETSNSITLYNTDHNEMGEKPNSSQIAIKHTKADVINPHPTTTSLQSTKSAIRCREDHCDYECSRLNQLKTHLIEIF